ncbi:MAG: hypothetical protein K2P78_05745 [Gemmataceae bacterium]|nr:hypothetical protein [Gemmataceae bacterium]
MSTDQQQPPAPTAPAPVVPPVPPPPAAPNPLTEKLSSVWVDFKGGKLIGYKFMALFLILAVAIGLGVYLWQEGRTADSAKWAALDKAGTEQALDDFIKANPDNYAGRVARLHKARLKLGPKGIEAAAQAATRPAAIQSIESAKEDFQKLADEFKDDPPFKAQCYLGLAHAEVALIGLEKHGAKGSIDKLIEYLDKLGAIDESTPWCKQAREFSAALKDKTRPTRDELARIQQEIYDLPAMGPGDAGPGGFPGGLGPTAPIPGLPGGHPTI